MSYLHDLAKSGHLAQREQPGDIPRGYRPVRSGWITGSQGIQIDKLVWLAALCCAVLLLFAPLSPRDTWVHMGADVRGDAGSVSTGNAWALVISLAGFVATCSLAIAAVTRQKPVIPPFCTAVGTIAFGLAALSSGFALTDRATWSAALPGFRLHFTGWADTFVVITLVAVACSTVLTVMWSKPAQDDW